MKKIIKKILFRQRFKKDMKILLQLIKKYENCTFDFFKKANFANQLNCILCQNYYCGMNKNSNLLKCPHFFYGDKKICNYDSTFIDIMYIVEVNNNHQYTIDEFNDEIYPILIDRVNYLRKKFNLPKK